MRRTLALGGKGRLHVLSILHIDQSFGLAENPRKSESAGKEFFALDQWTIFEDGAVQGIPLRKAAHPEV